MTSASEQPTIDPAAARRLLDQAREVRAQAYAPYSNFSVGAALLAEDGRVFTGVNVENASYPLGTCAERTAIGNAVTQGARHFVAIAVVGPEDDAACAPCGGCRQVLNEFGPDMPVIMPGGGPAGVQITTVRALLPGAFDQDRLNATREAR